MHLTGKDAAEASHLLDGSNNEDDTLVQARAKLAEEFGVPVPQIRAVQQYIVLVCVIAQRKRRGIPFAGEMKRAKQLQRAMSPGARKLLCDDLRFAI